MNDANVLDALIVTITGDLSNLKTSFTAAATMSQQAGQQAGQAFNTAFGQAGAQTSGLTTEMRRWTNLVRDEVKAGVGSVDSLTAALRNQRDELKDVMAATTRGSAAYREYVSELGRVETELKQLDRAQDQVNQSHVQTGASAAGLGAQFGGLRASIAGAAAAAAAWSSSQAIQGLVSLTDEANRANTAVIVFDKTMQRFGVNVDGAGAVADRLAKQFGVSANVIKDAISTIVRAGGRDLPQLEKAMLGAGASALLAGRQATDGFDALASAVATGLSNSLNGIGIAENVGPALAKVGKEAGKTADELDDVTRASTVLGLVSKATATEVEVLPQIMNDYARSQAEAKDSARLLREELGNSLTPAVSALMAEATAAMRGALDWARANRGELKESLEAAAIAATDAVGAFKVLSGLFGDITAAVGGVVTVFVGLGASIVGGLTGGISAGIEEIKKLFQSGLESLAAFQKAWEQLKKGDLSGAWNTMQTAGAKARDTILNAPGNVLAGASDGANFGKALVGEGVADLKSVGSRTMNATESANASSGRIRDALDGVVVGQELITALGMVGKRRGAAFGEKYLGNTAVHNGEDFFAPNGTPLLAPFTGKLTTRWSKTTGNIIEMVDAEGQKILLGHLKDFAAGLQDAVKKAGKGGLMVKAGTVIGTIGETGTLANSMGAKNNAHVHMMGYNSQGQIMSPLGVKYRGFDAEGTWAGTPGMSNTPTPTKDDDTPVSAAQIAKAQALIAAVDKAKKALEADPKNIGLTQALSTVTREMEKFSKASEGNREALARVRDGMGGLKKSAGEYIATQADVKKFGNDALRLIKDQEAAQKSGDAGRIASAKQALEAWQGESKAKAAVIEVEQAAYQSRQQAAEKAKADRERATRDREEADKAAEASAADQAKLYAQVAEEEAKRQKQRNAKAAESAEAARQGRIRDAQLSLKDLEDYRAQDLKTVEGNLLKTLNVEKTYAALIRDAKRKIAAAQYADDVRDAQNRNASTPDAARLARELKEAERVRNQASRAAGREATNRVGDAEQQQAEKVRGLRDQYSKLADSIREQAKAGTFDAEAKQAAQKAFNLLGAAAKEAGLSQDKYVEGARKTVNVLISQGEAASASTVRLKEQGQALEGVLKTFREGELKGLGSRTDADLVSLYGVARANGDLELAQAVLDEIERRTLEMNARLNASYEEGSAARLAAIKTVADADQEAADDALLSVDTLMGMLRELRTQQLDPRTSGFTGMLDEWIAKGGSAGKAAEYVKDNLTDLLAIMGFIKDAGNPLDMGIAPSPARTPGALKMPAEGGPSAPRGTRTPTVLGEAVEARGAGANAEWDKLQQNLSNAAWLKETADKLKTLDAAQLAAAKSAAIARKDVAAFTAVTAEEARRAEEAAGAIKKLAEQADPLAKFNKYADYVGQLGAAFQNVGSSIGGDLGANIAGFGKALNLTVDIAKDIVSGNYFAAAIKLFQGLAEALGGYAKANAQALKQQKDFNEQFTFIQGDDFAKTFTRSRGFFADLFGGGPEVVQGVDKLGLVFAKSMEGGFVGGLKNGMSAALKSGDFNDFTKTLNQAIYDAVVDGFSEAFLKSIQSEMIGPALKAWADALKTPGTEDDQAALAGIKTAVGDANALGQAYFSQVQPIVAGLGQEYGIDQGGMGSTESGSMFGAAPGAQLGLQRVEVSLPESFTRALDSFTPAVGEFRSGVAEWRAINQRFDALVSQLTRPGASGLGGLT